MTRDSRWLFAIQVIAGLFGLFGVTVTKPEDYGLTVVELRWISLMGLLVSNAASQLKESPLRSKRERGDDLGRVEMSPRRVQVFQPAVNVRRAEPKPRMDGE